MEKLTIEQLKNYLGTGLQCETIHKTISRVELKNKVFKLTGINNGMDKFPYFTDDPNFCNQFGCIGKYFYSYEFKPIMYRLSDLDKHIPELGFVPLEELQRLQLGSLPRSLDYKWLYYHQFEQLCKWHFWIFDQSYFKKGLIIDKLTYK